MDSTERKKKLESSLRMHHGKQRREALNQRIIEFGGDPHSLAWLNPEETDRVLDSYVDKYGSPIEGHVVLRVPLNSDVRSRSWRNLRAAASELALPSDRIESFVVLFNDRWYLGAAKTQLSQLTANLIPFALADGEIIAAYSTDMSSGLILDVKVGEDESVGGEVFLWGPDLINALLPHSD